MTNADRAREIVLELCGHDGCHPDRPCALCRAAIPRIAHALDAAEERGCAIGFEAAYKALRGPREGCMCAEKNSIALLKLDPAAVCAERRGK